MTYIKPEGTGKRDLAYSNWHRFALAGDNKMVDIDSLEYCQVCRRAVIFVELAAGLHQTRKPAPVLAVLAAQLDIPAFIALYEPGAACTCTDPNHPNQGCNHGINRFKVQPLHLPHNVFNGWDIPKTWRDRGMAAEWSELTPEQWTSILHKLRSEHVCAGRTVWPRKAGARY